MKAAWFPGGPTPVNNGLNRKLRPWRAPSATPGRLSSGHHHPTLKTVLTKETFDRRAVCRYQVSYRRREEEERPVEWPNWDCVLEPVEFHPVGTAVTFRSLLFVCLVIRHAGVCSEGSLFQRVRA